MTLHDFNVSVDMRVFDRDADSFRKFNGMAHCVTQLFPKFITRIDTKCGKMIVHVCTADILPVKPHYNGLQLWETGAIFDFDNFWNATADSQKRILLDTLYSGTLELARDLVLASDVFTAAYEACLKINIENAWLSEKRYRNSKHRSLFARLSFLHDFTGIHVGAVVYEKDVELGRIHIASLRPHDMYLHRALGKIEFEGNQIRVISKNGDETHVGHINEILAKSRPANFA